MNSPLSAVGCVACASRMFVCVGLLNLQDIKHRTSCFIRTASIFSWRKYIGFTALCFEDIGSCKVRVLRCLHGTRNREESPCKTYSMCLTSREHRACHGARVRARPRKRAPRAIPRRPSPAATRPAGWPRSESVPPGEKNVVLFCNVQDSPSRCN